MKLGEGIKMFLNQKKHLSEGLDRQAILKIFDETTGPGLSNYIRSKNFDKGTLYIGVSSSALKTELLYAKEKLIKKINQQTGKEVLKKIVILDN